MRDLLKYFRRYFSGVVPGRKKGQTLVEYSLVLAILTILALGVFSAMGHQIGLIFSNIDAILDTAEAS